MIWKDALNIPDCILTIGSLSNEKFVDYLASERMLSDEMGGNRKETVVLCFGFMRHSLLHGTKLRNVVNI